MTDSPCRRYPVDEIRLRGPDEETAPFRCKGWDCPDCGPWMKDRLEREIAKAVRGDPHLHRFVTLTLGPEARSLSESEAWDLLQEAWHRLRARLRRRYEGNVGYIWIREPHQDGTPHQHVLVNRYIPQSWLSEIAEEVGMGPVVDIRAVDTQRVIRYLSKYMSKGGVEIPEGRNRYGAGGTTDLGSPYPDGGGEWYVELKLSDGTWEPIMAGTIGLALMAVGNAIQESGPPARERTEDNKGT